jgi:hypothetical protein
MFSVITNIFNKKTKGPTLMELFTATGKLKKFFWQLEMFDVCTTGNTAHIDMIFKFLPHTHQHGCIDLLSCCSDPCRARMVLSVGGSFAYFARNAHCTVTTDLTCVIFQHTQWLPPPERPFSHYIHSHRLAAEMWTTMRNNLGKKYLSCSFCLYRFCKNVSYSFPIINFCNPRVH